MKCSDCLILVGILLFFSCSKENHSEYSPSPDYYIQNDDVRFVSAFEHEIELSNPSPVSTDIIGIGGISIRDGIVVIKQKGEDKLFKFLSAKDYQEFCSGVGVGGGPMEIPNESLSLSGSCTLFKEGGNLHLGIYHMYKGRFLDIDLTQTNKEKTLSAQLTDSLSTELFMAKRVGPNRYITKQLTEDKKSQHLSFWSKGQVSATDNLTNLNLAETETDFNLLGSIPDVSPDGKWLADAMVSLNQINFIPTDERKRGFTVCTGEKLSNLREEDLRAQKFDERRVYYQDTKAHEKYVCFKYVDLTMMDYMQKQNIFNAVVQCFDWKGNPLAKITLDRPIRYFDINETRQTLLVLDMEDNLLEYELPEFMK